MKAIPASRIKKLALQRQDYSCGAVSLKNAAALLGVAAPTEGEVIRLTRTTRRDGTDEGKIKAAARKMGLKVRDRTWGNEGDIDAAWGWVVAELRRGRPVILCVDDFEHWVLATGMRGGRVLVHDPAVKEQELPVESYSKPELKARWWMNDGNTGAQYYALSVGK